MQISLSSPFAAGRTAEVYEWKDGYVLKLYHDWCPPHWVENESKVAHAVVAAGIPTPAPGEIVEVNGRRGLVYERVTGLSMLEDMNARPWRIPRHARSLAELQVKVNRLSVSGLPSAREGLAATIRRAPGLDDELRARVSIHLASLPDGETVCHGDFHPGNVIMTRRGATIIDWMTASAGNPWSDVARTSMLLTVGAKSAGNLLSPMARLLIRLYHRLYLARYTRLVPDKESAVARWMPIIAAARLDERIDGEQALLMEMIRDGLRDPA